MASEKQILDLLVSTGKLTEVEVQEAAWAADNGFNQIVALLHSILCSDDCGWDMEEALAQPWTYSHHKEWYDRVVISLGIIKYEDQPIVVSKMKDFGNFIELLKVETELGKSLWELMYKYGYLVDRHTTASSPG